jgi:hypothetical protein
MNMKDMIQRMTDLENEAKQALTESTQLDECPPMEGPGMEPMDRGNPVSINVSMNASGKEHVEDLLDMMKKAGLGSAEPVSAKMLSPRMDMERLRGIVDDPKIPGRDDVEGDQDLQAAAGTVNSVGDIVGDGPTDVDRPSSPDTTVGSKAQTMDSIEEGGMKDELIKAMEKIAADDSGELLYKALSKGAMGPEVQKYLQDMYDDVAVDNGLHPDDDHDQIEAKMIDQIEADYGMGESYANEPEEEYQDTKYMTKDLSGGLNREKKAYKAAQDGDNAMAVETLYHELMAQYKTK